MNSIPYVFFHFGPPFWATVGSQPQPPCVNSQHSVPTAMGQSFGQDLGLWLPCVSCSPGRVVGRKTFPTIGSLPETNSKFAPENGWLEDDPFLLGWLIFRGKLVVSKFNMVHLKMAPLNRRFGFGNHHLFVHVKHLGSVPLEK